MELLKMKYKQDVDFPSFCELCRTKKAIMLSCIANEMGTFLNKLCVFINESSCSYIAMCTLLWKLYFLMLFQGLLALKRATNLIIMEIAQSNFYFQVKLC